MSISNSTFSFQDFDNVLATSMSGSSVVGTTRSSGGSTAPSSTVSPSGESSLALAVSLLTTKIHALWVPASTKSYCFGVVNHHKFCIKPSEGGSACAIASHQRKFTPTPGHAYLLDTEIRAFCTPCYDGTLLSPAQVLRLHGVTFTRADWDSLFAQLAAKTPPKWLAFEIDTSPEPVLPSGQQFLQGGARELLSPRDGGLLHSVPSLSFDTSVDGEDLAADVDWTSHSTLVFHVRRLSSHFASLQAKWRKAFMEVDAGYSVLVQDLHQLQENTSAVRGDLGTPPLDSTFQLSWEGLVTCLQQFSALSATVSNQVNTLDELDAKHSTLHQVVTDSCLSLADSSSDLSTKVNELTSSLRALESRVLRLIPFLQQVRRNPVDSTSPVSADHPDFSAVLHRVKKLETLVDNIQTRQQSWESTCQDMFLSNPSSSPTPLAAQIQELSAQMKQLKLRVVGKGVQIGKKFSNRLMRSRRG